MKTVLIGGGSGLIGNQLSQLLTKAGYEVRHLSRSKAQNGTYRTFLWDPAQGTIDEAAFAGLDYVINLAGAGVADKRWTEERKQLIIQSRVQSTQLLWEQARKSESVQAFISASAIGFYGSRGNDWLDEESAAGEGFLPESVTAWEQAVFAEETTNIRTAALRIGIVLSTQGGALKELIRPARFGLNTYFGDGQQWYSWIHIEDLCRMFHYLLEHDELTGIFNAVAPDPQRNKAFVQTLRQAMGTPGFTMPVPDWLLRIPFGEMGDVVLDSARVRSQKIRDAGFTFQYPELQAALRNLLTRKI